MQVNEEHLLLQRRAFLPPPVYKRIGRCSFPFPFQARCFLILIGLPRLLSVGESALLQQRRLTW
jgi:hypothetical protein